MPTRAEASAVAPAVTPTPAPLLATIARWSSHPAAVRVGASLLGAVTAVGAFVLLLVGLIALALLIGRLSDTSPGGLISGLASGALPISVFGALSLSAVVVASFACGGFVACRIVEADVRRQSLAVWAWAVLLPALFLLVALLSLARSVVASVPVTGMLLLFATTLAAMALLGCMLGGESARRARRSAVALRP